MRLIKILTLVGLASLLALSGCISSEANLRSYVAADRLDWAVLGTQNYQYIMADTRLDEAAKLSYWRRLNAKEDALLNAEQLLGLPAAARVVPIAPPPVVPGNGN